ncbi:MAG TPA: EVE domain-containing protein [Chthoniobacterales bacterium]
MAKHWLVKQQPTVYSWQQLVTDRAAVWGRVRNFQARLSVAPLTHTEFSAILALSVKRAQTG